MRKLYSNINKGLTYKNKNYVIFSKAIYKKPSPTRLLFQHLCGYVEFN